MAIGEAFHLGRASRGMRPIVPVVVPFDVAGRCAEADLLRGVNNGVKNREEREEDVVVVETERFRGVGVARRESRLALGGRELTLFPERMDEVRDAAGEIAPWVSVVVLVVLPEEVGLCSVTILSPFTWRDKLDKPSWTPRSVSVISIFWICRWISRHLSRRSS